MHFAVDSTQTLSDISYHPGSLLCLSHYTASLCGFCLIPLFFLLGRTSLMYLLWGCQLPGLERPLPVWACVIAAGELTGEIRRDGSLFEQNCWHRVRGRLSILIDGTGMVLLFALDWFPGPLWTHAWMLHQWIIASEASWLNFYLHYVTFQSLPQLFWGNFCQERFQTCQHRLC